MNTFTQGPWFVDENGVTPDNEGIDTVVIFGPDGAYFGRVAVAYAECGYRDELLPNAHLIALAPLMFNFIQDLVDATPEEARVLIEQEGVDIVERLEKLMQGR